MEHVGAPPTPPPTNTHTHTSERKPGRRCRHPEALNFHSTAVSAAAGPPDMPTAHWESISLCFLLIHHAEQKVAASLSWQLLQVLARSLLTLTPLNPAQNVCAGRCLIIKEGATEVCDCMRLCLCVRERLQPWRSQACSK